MNVQLVESLVAVIESLSLEEKGLLKARLETSEKSDDEIFKRIELSIEKDLALRGGKPINPPVKKIIHKLRKERDKQILSLV